MKSIEAISISFKDFFLAEGDDKLKGHVSPRLLVPSFQRNYAWDKKHIKELIESINTNGKEYYIGNVLIQKIRTQDLIIDGQQRITTVMLIIKALEQRLSDFKKNLANKILFYNQEQEILRVEFTRKNLLKSFDKIVKHNDFDESSFEDDNSKRFLKNFNFIKKELLKIDDINEFFDKVVNLVFVVIKFDRGFDVNQLFEGLNSKGKILSPVQLTKNVLIGSAKGLDLEDDVVKIWEDMEKEFEKSKSILWFDKFLRHRGFYKYGYVSNKNLFSKIKKEIGDASILAFSQEMKDDSLLYLKIRAGKLAKDDIAPDISQSDWIRLNHLIEHISKMELDQVYSALFSAIKYAKTYQKYRAGANSRFYRDVYRIWAFSIMTKYLDTKPSLFERNFADYSHRLYLNEYSKSQENFSAFKKIVSNSSKQRFVENLNLRIRITGEHEKNLSSKNDRNYVSLLILFYLSGGTDFIVRGQTIEHIVPKGDLSKWEIGRRYLNDVKKDRYKFGNLTLLEKDTLGNESFVVKTKLYKKSKYQKNKRLHLDFQEFASKKPSDAINSRGLVMASTLYDILKKQI
jgi:uncharacterized protein with ParB-like and HNH nuclease domain